MGALGNRPTTATTTFGTFDVQDPAGAVVGSVTARDILPLVARFG